MQLGRGLVERVERVAQPRTLVAHTARTEQPPRLRQHDRALRAGDLDRRRRAGPPELCDLERPVLDQLDGVDVVLLSEELPGVVSGAGSPDVLVEVAGAEDDSRGEPEFFRCLPVSVISRMISPPTA